MKELDNYFIQDRNHLLRETVGRSYCTTLPQEEEGTRIWKSAKHLQLVDRWPNYDVTKIHILRL